MRRRGMGKAVLSPRGCFLELTVWQALLLSHTHGPGLVVHDSVFLLLCLKNEIIHYSFL